MHGALPQPTALFACVTIQPDRHNLQTDLLDVLLLLLYIPTDYF